MPRRLTRSRLQCSWCGDVVESFSRHDWQACGCWEVVNPPHHGVFLDGGLSYVHYGGPDMATAILMSEYEGTDQEPPYQLLLFEEDFYG